MMRKASIHGGTTHREGATREGAHAGDTRGENEFQHQGAVERLAFHAWTALPGGQVDFISERLAALTGAAAFRDDNINVVHAADRARTVAAWVHAVATGTPFDIEHRIHMLGGGERWMRSRANPQRVGSGRVVRWHGFSEDVHEAKQAAALLAQREARLLAVTNSVAQLIWSNGPDGSVDYRNQAWHDFTGLPPGPAAGSLWLPPDLLERGLRHPEDEDRCSAAWLRSLQTGEPYHLEYRLRHRSGGYRWVLARAHAVRDAAGCIERWFGTLADIHEIVEAREELARSHAEAERARWRAEDINAAKSRFLAAASHDLRQPLQTMALLECLLAKQVDGEAGRLVARLGETLGTMAGMLDALLDINAAEPGKGPVLSVEAARIAGAEPSPAPAQAAVGGTAAGAGHRPGRILMIEDDPDLRSALQALLLDEGHSVMAASSGPAALSMVERSLVAPDLILAAYNLPEGLNGLQATAKVRDMLARAVPAIILTGATRAATLRDIALHGCIHLSKPVKPSGLLQAVRDLLPAPPASAPRRPEAQPKAPRRPNAPVVHVVDDDGGLRDAIRRTLEHGGQAVEEYPSGEAFLAAYRAHPPIQEECLLIDAAMPGMGGLEVLRQLNAGGRRLPAIMITGRSDVSMAVHAMKAGALDFIEKPVSAPELLEGIARALERSRDVTTQFARQTAAADSVARLTHRQRDVMAMMLAGQLNKNIAADLGISQRTVETHRATIMRRMGVKSLPALARLALTADPDGMAGGGQPAGSRGAASR